MANSSKADHGIQHEGEDQTRQDKGEVESKDECEDDGEDEPAAKRARLRRQGANTFWPIRIYEAAHGGTQPPSTEIVCATSVASIQQKGVMLPYSGDGPPGCYVVTQDKEGCKVVEGRT